jgi:hypothetical protein
MFDALVTSLFEHHASVESLEMNINCGVCGAAAHGYNFDQITCESCKAFFRRHARRNTVRRFLSITSTMLSLLVNQTETIHSTR